MTTPDYFVERQRTPIPGRLSRKKERVSTTCGVRKNTASTTGGSSCPNMGEFVPLIKIRLFNTLEDDFAVADLIGQIRLEEGAEFQIVDRATLHGLKIGIFVNTLPVHHLAKILLQDHIHPDACGASIPLPEGMGDVHLYIFGDDLFKTGFWHFFNDGQNFFQIETAGKAEIALGDIHLAELSGKVVEAVKEIFVYLLQTSCCAHFHLVDIGAFKETERVVQAAFINIHGLPCQLSILAAILSVSARNTFENTRTKADFQCF